jgi:YspA, cpYpsA-related SLOG family
MKPRNSTSLSSFADLDQVYADATASPAYARAFVTDIATSQLSIVQAPTSDDMPDAYAAQQCVRAIIGELFALMNETRMQPLAQRLAWGIVNSFHVVARQIETQEDSAALKLGELARISDPSEVHASEVEDAQMLCQSLAEARAALEVMRDHAGEVYRAESGHPFSPLRGSRVSSVLTASQIDSRDFLCARAKARREQLAPSGPVVVISGGQDWADHQRIWDRLDLLKIRVPSMTLATTAQGKGVDAIAAAWAAAREVPLIAFRLNRAHGNAAPFKRNKTLCDLQPIEAIICEGSGVQANLAERMRDAGVPVTVFYRDAAPRDSRRAA